MAGSAKLLDYHKALVDYQPGLWVHGLVRGSYLHHGHGSGQHRRPTGPHTTRTAMRCMALLPYPPAFQPGVTIGCILPVLSVARAQTS